MITRIRQWCKRWRRRKRVKQAKGSTSPAVVGAQGQPLRVIQGPLSEGRSARNIARIAACKQGMAKLAMKGMEDHKAYRAFGDELAERQVRYNNDEVIKKLRKEGGL